MAVLPKDDTLNLFENYVKLFCYIAYPLTFSFQMQFINFHYSVNIRSAIKCSLKKEQLSEKWPRDLKTKRIKHNHDRKRKSRQLKKDMRIKKNSQKGTKKNKYVENRTPEYYISEKKVSRNSTDAVGIWKMDHKNLDNKIKH